MIMRPYELWVYGLQNFWNAVQFQLSLLLKRKLCAVNRETGIIQVLAVNRKQW
jgi:hypothetical protein